MKLEEYILHDATALADLVQRGEVTPGELLDCAIAQADRLNPVLNAICLDMRQQAREQLARQTPTGPFAGVPFLIKDGGQDYAGLPTSCGSRGMSRLVPAEHANVTRRFLQSGLVVFGKTNVPELMLKAFTDSELLGHARNPWDTTRTPGGSSGGSGAAVAAGIVPMAGANDGGGSIRIPASYGGLVGLRPSRGRISCGPLTNEVWAGASSEGVLSRSVRDTARMLDVLQGAEPGDPFEIPPPAQPYESTMNWAPLRLRIGFTTRSPLGTPVHAEAVKAVTSAASLLRELGHEVVEAEPEVNGQALAVSYLHLYFGQVSASVARAKAAGARRDEFELLTRTLDALGRATPSGIYVREQLAWNAYARALGRFHQQHDLLLTPTVATPPPQHGAADLPALQRWALGLLEGSGLLGLLTRLGLTEGLVQQIARDSLSFVPFTQLANLTGTPAISLPLHHTPEGLPMGVQFVARHGREDLLLQLGRQLELARPWADRRPRL